MSTSKTVLHSLGCKTRTINPELNGRDEIKLNRRRIWWNKSSFKSHSLWLLKESCIKDCEHFYKHNTANLSPRSPQPETEGGYMMMVMKRRATILHRPLSPIPGILGSPWWLKMAMEMAVNEAQWVFLSHVFSWLLDSEMAPDHFQGFGGQETNDLWPASSAPAHRTLVELMSLPTVPRRGQKSWDNNSLPLYTRNQKLPSFLPSLFPVGNADLGLN